jgi:hypothetical protein
MKQQCSSIFEEVFDSHTGGCVRTCNCGKIHFDGSNNGWTWEDGEFETLQKRAKEYPNKYVERDGTISCMEIGGKEIVYGCDCETAEQFEKFLISHASKLADYLNKRSEMLKKMSEHMVVKST